MFLVTVRRGVSAGVGSLLALGLAALPLTTGGPATAAGVHQDSGRVSALRSGMWHPDGTVDAVATHGKLIYVGGDFRNMVNADSSKTERRVRIAALNNKTGALIKKFHPRVNGEIQALAIFRRDLYVGGNFTKINGKKRHHLAVLRLSNGRLMKSPGLALDGPTYAFLHLGKRLYVGGDFRHVGKVHQARLFAIDSQGRRVEGWPVSARGANGPVFTLAPSPTRKAVLVGGHFHQLDARAKDNLGAVNLHGRLMKWAPPAACLSDCPVRDLAVSRKLIYAGIDGPGGRVRAYRWSTGKTAWSDKTDGDVDAVALSGTNLFIGGHFTEVLGLSRPMFAVVDATTGAVSSRTESSSGSVFPGILTIHVSHGVALLGGAFDDIDGQPRLAVVAP